MTRRQLHNQSTLKRFKKLQVYVAEISMVLKKLKTFDEVIRTDHWIEWKEVVDREMKAIQENQTWALEELPTGNSTIPCKWRYKIKTNVDGSVHKFRTKLVINPSMRDDEQSSCFHPSRTVSVSNTHCSLTVQPLEALVYG